MRALLLSTPLLLVACATPSPPPTAVQPRPIRHAPGQPTAIEALGSRYVFAPRFDLTSEIDQPGIRSISFVDRVTACRGSAYFRTVTDATKVRQVVDQTDASIKKKAESMGAQSQMVVAPFRLWEHDGRVLKRTLVNPKVPQDHHAFWNYDVFLSEQPLAIWGLMDCQEELLLQKTWDEIMGTLGAQGKAGRPPRQDGAI
jgi:hypothetical protein